ncbi:hypothetical protein ACEPAF_4318 [Sanghuangporus sanghuang]
MRWTFCLEEILHELASTGFHWLFTTVTFVVQNTMGWSFLALAAGWPKYGFTSTYPGLVHVLSSFLTVNCPLANSSLFQDIKTRSNLLTLAATVASLLATVRAEDWVCYSFPVFVCTLIVCLRYPVCPLSQGEFKSSWSHSSSSPLTSLCFPFYDPVTA